jgi:hypothetical protein
LRDDSLVVDGENGYLTERKAIFDLAQLLMCDALVGKRDSTVMQRKSNTVSAASLKTRMMER